MVLFAGIIVFIAGLGRLLFLFHDRKNDLELFSRGIQVSAKIIDRITYPNDDSLQSSQYRLIASFKDSCGCEHFVKSRGNTCGAESRKMIGSYHTILYLESDPERAIFLADKKKHISYFSLIGNSLAAIIGIFLILLHIFFA